MENKKFDELLAALRLIAMNKSMLPMNLRGWVNILGLYVQEKRIGQLAQGRTVKG